jgi:ribonuclease T1
MDAGEMPGRLSTSPPARGGAAQRAGVVGGDPRLTKFKSALMAVVLGLLCVLPAAQARDGAPAGPAIEEVAAAKLPAEARRTITLIRQGGPFAHQRDGAAFGNFEKRLPAKERGYYREYTVRTPGAKNRGARRIVAGKDGELYYTDDHYRSFRRIREIP